MHTPTTESGPDSGSTSTESGRADLELRLWKLCAWCGPIYIVGVLICFAGVAGFLPPPRQYWSAAQVAEFFTTNEVRIRLGMEGVIFFAVFYLPFSVAMSRVMERVEGPGRLLSRIQLCGGLSTAAVTISCAVVWLTASFRAVERAPEDIRLLNDAAFMIFALTIMVTVFQIVAFGALWLLSVSEQAVPRWFGYFSLSCVVAVLPVFLIPSLEHGPFAWHGLINFYVGLGAFGSWVLVASWATLRAIDALSRESAT